MTKHVDSDRPARERAQRPRRRPSGQAAARADLPARGRCQGERQRLAYESARIMAEQGVTEFDRARRKAAQRIGVGDRRCWPDNQEIQAALLQHLRLFRAEHQQQVTADLRAQALAAMAAFSDFDPRLVGQAAAGTATRKQGVQLHLYAEDSAEILFRLLDRGIPWQERDGLFRYAGGASQTHPVLAFVAGDVPVELVVLPPRAKRNPPLSPVTERPERGLTAAELRRLLEQDGTGDAP